MFAGKDFLSTFAPAFASKTGETSQKVLLKIFEKKSIKNLVVSKM